MEWDLNEAGLAQLGIPRPDITPENELMIRVWNFCDGWNPALVAAGAAYYGVGDLDFLVDQLLAIRDCINEHRQA